MIASLHTLTELDEHPGEGKEDNAQPDVEPVHPIHGCLPRGTIEPSRLKKSSRSGVGALRSRQDALRSRRIERSGSLEPRRGVSATLGPWAPTGPIPRHCWPASRLKKRVGIAAS